MLILTHFLGLGALRIKKREAFKITYQYDQYINPLILAAFAVNLFK